MFNTAKLVRELTVPIFIAHGNKDNKTPNNHSLKIFRRANGPKELYVIPGIGHEEIWMLREEIKSNCYRALRRFIETNL